MHNYHQPSAASSPLVDFDRLINFQKLTSQFLSHIRAWQGSHNDSIRPTAYRDICRKIDVQDTPITLQPSLTRWRLSPTQVPLIVTNEMSEAFKRPRNSDARVYKSEKCSPDKEVSRREQRTRFTIPYLNAQYPYLAGVLFLPPYLDPGVSKTKDRV